MPLIDEMRGLSLKGKNAAEAEERRKCKEKQTAREAIRERARAAVPQRLEEAITQAKAAAAKSGTYQSAYQIGEGCEFVWDLAHMMVEELKKQGFKAASHSQEHRPFGSDPGRYDTYTDVWVEISW